MLNISLISEILPSQAKQDNLRAKVLRAYRRYSQGSAGVIILLLVLSVITWQSSFSKNTPPRAHYVLVGESPRVVAAPKLEPETARATENDLNGIKPEAGLAPSSTLTALALPSVLVATEPPAQAAQASRGLNLRSATSTHRRSRTAIGRSRHTRTNGAWSLYKGKTPVESARLVFACVLQRLSPPPVRHSKAHAKSTSGHRPERCLACNVRKWTKAHSS